jgi:hypothetical protein
LVDEAPPQQVDQREPVIDGQQGWINGSQPVAELIDIHQVPQYSDIDACVGNLAG